MNEPITYTREQLREAYDNNVLGARQIVILVKDDVGYYPDTFVLDYRDMAHLIRDQWREGHPYLSGYDDQESFLKNDVRRDFDLTFEEIEVQAALS